MDMASTSNSSISGNLSELTMDTNEDATPSNSVINVHEILEQRENSRKRTRSDSSNPIEQKNNKRGKPNISTEIQPTYKNLRNISTKITKLENQQEFLMKCLDSGRIPRGLQVICQPNIGREDLAFMKKWKSILGDCSFQLMSTLSDYMGNQISDLEVTKSKLSMEIAKAKPQDREEANAALQICCDRVKKSDKSRLERPRES